MWYFWAFSIIFQWRKFKWERWNNYLFFRSGFISKIKLFSLEWHSKECRAWLGLQGRPWASQRTPCIPGWGWRLEENLKIENKMFPLDWWSHTGGLGDGELGLEHGDLWYHKHNRGRAGAGHKGTEEKVRISCLKTRPNSDYSGCNYHRENHKKRPH